MIDPDWIAREESSLMANYRRQPVMFTHGSGASLYAADGRRYVDCMAGISMINVGHCHPDVVEAICRQAEQLINVSNLYYTGPMIELAEWIRDNSMGGRVFFCNSGAEANEAALKLARKYGGPSRPEVVALEHGFHGRTYGALTLTGQPDKQVAFSPLVPEIRHVARDDLDALAAAVGPRTCAIFLEIVQGEVGVHPIRTDMLHLARELCDRYGALLVVDEIQTGLSRTGPLFAYQDVGIEPDVMCLAKSLGGGVPIGAVTARPGVDATFTPGDHGSTFAGSPLACAAGLASCQILADPGLQASVRVKGQVLLEGLQRLVEDGLATDARGRGLMCAIDVADPRAGELTEAMLQQGYLVNNTSAHTLRFLPPLVIEDEDLAGLVASLRAVLSAR